MDKNRYYCVTTRRFTLRCGQEARLRKTQELYNEVLYFYYDLFLKLEGQEPGSLSGLSGREVLRELERRSIVGRDKWPVPYPIPWKKAPLYFRRAAINSASSAARGYLSGRKAGIPVGRAERFQKGVTFYKGMYRELTQRSVSLKVYDGERWSWLNCRLSGNVLPEEAEILSPSVSLTSRCAFLLVPVKERVADGRTARMRMQEESKVCGIQFTNGDAFAVGVVLNPDGNQSEVRFFKGGKRYRHQCGELLERIRTSEAAMGLSAGERRTVTKSAEAGETGDTVRDNNRYWRKLKNISDYYAHSVSRQIVDFAAENRAGILVLPRYDEKFTRYVMRKSGNWSPLHLSGKIREMISYKAWKAGIIVLEVNPGNTSSYCAVCGLQVKKRGENFECPGGHRGNRYLNTARNLGKKCLRGFGKEI